MVLFRTILLLPAFFILMTGVAQDDLDRNLQQAESELIDLRKKEAAALQKIEDFRLQRINRDLHAFAIPKLEEGDVLTEHAAMILCYDEAHEQAKWVTHIILPQIKEGNIGRTNDFRIDSLVSTGTAVKEDYWESGFDRGHLAPSADFRWSRRALSESYLYSNMSPQRPELNRQSWATLEGAIREYVENHGRQVYVVTGGVLRDGLPTVGENKVSIPEWYYKVIVDLDAPTPLGIAFLLPNERIRYPIWSYAVSIDSVEKVTGIDFFQALPDDLENNIESQSVHADWKIEDNSDEAEPLDPTKLERGQFNTLQAKYHVGDEVTVCGKVVSTKYAEKSGNTYLNLDKKFPDHIFSIAIQKESHSNFSYIPHEDLEGKTICVTGTIVDNRGVPSVTITSEEQIIILEQ